MLMAISLLYLKGGITMPSLETMRKMYQVQYNDAQSVAIFMIIFMMTNLN